MEEQKLFKDILSEAIETSGISFDKLSNLTNVPERFISALIDADYSILPAAPYTKGYIKKIADTLNIDHGELWRAYERENKPLSSGEKDYLPKNRFLMRTRIDNKILTMIIGAIILVSYIGINASALIGMPELIISTPENPVSASAQELLIIRGKIGNIKDTVTVNGAGLDVNEYGEFEKEFRLNPGINDFEISAKRFLGRTMTESRQVIYEQLPIDINKPNNKNINNTDN